MSRTAPTREARRSALVRVVGLSFRALWVAIVVATPLLGAWVASSLAAHGNGKVAVTAAAGLLLFPVIPFAWEGWSLYRRRQRGVTGKRFLTLADRVILRTLTTNLLFLGVLVGTRPAAAFTALSTRGDWMLEGRTGPGIDTARRWIFRAADRLEWIYLAVHEDRFAQRDPDPPPVQAVNTGGSGNASTGAPVARTSSSGASSATSASSSSSSSSVPAPEVAPRETAVPSGSSWPVPPVLHPLVASMPADAEMSVESLGAYIHDHESTEAGRLKLVHDWVADRISYDGPSYRAGTIPPQSASAVMSRRNAVCAGYARLTAAVGKAAGLNISYVSGDARGPGISETGSGHAWNVARVDGREFLLDVTWDSGSLDGATFKKGYRTDYYLTPPEVFSVDHFPRDPRWQLRATPLSRGDFFRQPMMTPRSYAQRIELVSPARSQVDVEGELIVELRAPRGIYTSATVTGDGSTQHCTVERGALVRIRCATPGQRKYRVEMFSNTQEFGVYDFIGQIEANARR